MRLLLLTVAGMVWWIVYIVRKGIKETTRVIEQDVVDEYSDKRIAKAFVDYWNKYHKEEG